MIEKMNQENLDIVFGSRYIENGGISGWSFFRKLTSRVANFITVQSFGIDVSDFTNSFRIYKRELFEDLIKTVENKGFGFQMEIMVRAGWKKAKIGCVPIVFVDRIYGKSKLGPNEVYLYLDAIWRLLNTPRLNA
jgi:dolichol-phosphate mannosyltransferase